MLTDLEVLPVACKRVFYRPEHNTKGESMELNFEGLEVQNEIYQQIELEQ